MSRELNEQLYEKKLTETLGEQEYRKNREIYVLAFNYARENKCLGELGDIIEYAVPRYTQFAPELIKAFVRRQMELKNKADY